MDYNFDIGDTFVDDAIDGLMWKIVNIDYEDDEYPYECWPVDIIEKAKKIFEEDGGFTDEDGDFLEYNDYEEVLQECFIDERQCFSEYWIKDYECKQLKAEIKKLKAEIKKLKGEK